MFANIKPSNLLLLPLLGVVSMAVGACQGSATSSSDPTPRPNNPDAPAPIPADGTTPAVPSCRFDSRVVYAVPGSTDVIEGITVGSKYWNFKGTAADGYTNYIPLPGAESGALDAVSRYASGPCQGLGTACKFDTRTVYVRPNANEVIESITVGNKVYNFVATAADNYATFSPFAGLPTATLDSIDRYKNGPCQGLGASCRFDSRTVWISPSTNDLIESISVGNKFYNFKGTAADDYATLAPMLGAESGTLSGVTRYASGPCQASGENCTFDTRIMFSSPGSTDLMESISVGNNFWNYKATAASNYTDTVPLQGAATGALTASPRYVDGPCK